MDSTNNIPTTPNCGFESLIEDEEAACLVRRITLTSYDDLYRLVKASISPDDLPNSELERFGRAFARIYWPNQTATANTTTQYNFPSGADSIANGVQKPCLRRLSLSPNLVFLPIRRETHGCQLPRSSCRQQISQSHWPRCLRIVGLKYSRQKNGKNVEFIARWDWEERIKPRHSQALDCPR